MIHNIDTSRAVQRAATLMEKQQRREICTIGRRMYERGLVVATEGNLSVRLDAHRILVTPAGCCKGRLASRDILVTDLSGRVIRGKGRPSSEMQMHLLYYHARPDVRAICHAHPSTATAFAAAGRSLEAAVLPEVVVDLGKIPLAPYGTPGTWELCAGLELLVRKFDAVLLENHGVVTCGPDLNAAYNRMETVEQCARVMLTAELLGGPHLLSRAEVQKLVAGRTPRVSYPGESLDLPPASVEIPGTQTAESELFEGTVPDGWVRH
jgi:L-fuculose-phosphate aldolase